MREVGRGQQHEGNSAPCHLTICHPVTSETGGRISTKRRKMAPVHRDQAGQRRGSKFAARPVAPSLCERCVAPTTHLRTEPAFH